MSIANFGRKALAGVAVLSLLAGVLGAWLWAGRVVAAQRAERDDLHLFLDASSAGWAEATDRFFTVPEMTAQTIGSLSTRVLDNRVQSEASEELIALLADSIRSKQALDAAFLGFPDGGFVFVARSDDAAPGGFRSRVISMSADGERSVELTWMDQALTVVRSEQRDDDTYDPRARPWYGPIDQGARSTWTEPYVFASSGQPGITFSSAVADDGGALTAVVGVDIRLTQLSNFLDVLRPGPNGEALVVTDDGRVVAATAEIGPSTDDSLGAGQSMPAPAPLPLEESTSLSQLVRSIESGETNVGLARSASGVRTTAVRPVGTEGWYLAVRAFDADFLGEVSTEPAKNLFGVVAVGFTSAALVALASLAGVGYLGRLKNDADRDELTNVLSRRAAKRAAESALRSGETLWVAIIDLDGFKQVNDQHGHPVGDRALTKLAARMSAFAESRGAIIGRLGGDEFIVLSASDLDWHELVLALRAPFEVGGETMSLAASIGVTCSEPERSLSIEALLYEADRALYEAKRTGGNRHHPDTPLDIAT